VVPSNAYLCKDGRSVVIGANTDRLFAALMRVAGREDLASDPALASNPGRVEQVERIDAAIASWTGSRASDEVVLALSAAGIPAGPIYDAAAVAADPHFQERGLWEVATAEGRAFELPALAPKLTTTPGRTEWAGPALGAHTDEVLRERLGLDAAAILELRGRGVIR
jgi:crotonobetainyl-CoA:carnitine CoA-transferase CaiB-like acyl-CoA transferase